MANDCWEQLGLLLWFRVWLTRVRRHGLITLVQIGLMLVMMSSVWDDSVAPYRGELHRREVFSGIPPMELWGRPNESWNAGELAFAPNQTFFAELVKTVCGELPGKWKPVAFESAESASAYVGEDVPSPSNQTRRVAVWFNRTANNKLTYHVRFPDASFDTQDGYLHRTIFPGPADTDSYDEMS